MHTQSFSVRQSQTRAGFTLLELLIVLFLITLGYVTLYSAGLGQSTETNLLEQSKQQTITAIRYARQLALARGSAIAVKVGANRLDILEADLSTPVQSPIDRKDYTLVAPAGYSYETSGITAIHTGNDTHEAFFFEEQGRLAYIGSTERQFYPLKNALLISLRKKSNETVALLEISNVTGELMRP